MSASRLIAFVIGAFFLLSLDVMGQSVQTAQSGTATQQSTTSPPPPSRDAQAVTAAQNALTAGGGADALAGFKDFSATGTITFYQDADRQIQGSAATSGRGLNQYRIDAVTSQGTKSWGASGRQVSVETPDGRVTTKNDAPFSFRCPMLPGRELADALKDTSTQFSYIGPGEVNGHQVIEISIGNGNAPPKDIVDEHYREHFFLDATTSQIVKTARMLRGLNGQNIGYDELYFDNYENEAGVVVPLSITEVSQGQKLWSMQLNSIQFNVGLSAANFNFGSAQTSPTPVPASH